MEKQNQRVTLKFESGNTEAERIESSGGCTLLRLLATHAVVDRNGDTCYFASELSAKNYYNLIRKEKVSSNEG